jgi:hypothetical protein
MDKHKEKRMNTRQRLKLLAAGALAAAAWFAAVGDSNAQVPTPRCWALSTYWEEYTQCIDPTSRSVLAETMGFVSGSKVLAHQLKVAGASSAYGLDANGKFISFDCFVSPRKAGTTVYTAKGVCENAVVHGTIVYYPLNN